MSFENMNIWITTPLSPTLLTPQKTLFKKKIHSKYLQLGCLEFTLLIANEKYYYSFMILNHTIEF